MSGRTAKTWPARSAASADPLGHDAGLGPGRSPPRGPAPAGGFSSTSVIASSFSVLMTALFQVSGIAPPV